MQRLSSILSDGRSFPSAPDQELVHDPNAEGSCPRFRPVLSHSTNTLSPLLLIIFGALHLSRVPCLSSIHSANFVEAGFRRQWHNWQISPLREATLV